MDFTEVDNTEETGTTAQELYQSLVEAVKASNTPPDGAFTIQQFSEDAGVSETTARRVLEREIDKDIVNSRKFGRRRYYWFVEKENEK